MCHKLCIEKRGFMLTVSNLTYKIGNRTILDDCDVIIMDGWKAGIVGVNGAGKSTLFKLIAGDLQADDGKISISSEQLNNLTYLLRLYIIIVEKV
jgi:ATPase subunit of ABC transporter with duplicated ATPase domains